MTSTKAALFNALSRTDNPRRETLRQELARTKPTGRRAGLKPKLVLASASPRRLTLLAQAGIEPDALRPPSIDETPKKGEMPRSLITRLARTKAEEARDLIANDKDLADAYVMAADTIVAVGRRILVKPRFLEEALASLQLLSGRNHRVLTALCVITRMIACASRSSTPRCASSGCRRRRSRPTSPRANGAARPAATPSRAWPAASCRSWSAPTPTWSACR